MMARALILTAGIVLLAAAGVAFLTSLVVLIPVGETDADTWLGAGILLGGALLVGAIADVLILTGVRPRARRPATAAPERPDPGRPAPAPAVPGPPRADPGATAAAARRPAAGGVGLGSALGPALHELGFQLFGVAGGLVADLLTAFLERRRRASGELAPSVSAGHRGWMARTRAGLRTAAVLILLVLWVSAIGGLLGVVEGFVNAPATAWNTLTTDPALQVAVTVCLAVAGIGGPLLTRLRRC